MDSNNVRPICWCVFALIATPASASTEAVADARALGMGETRVAIAYSPQLNPALLSSNNDKKLFWEPATLAVRIADAKRVRAAVTGDYAVRDYYHGAGYAARAYARNSLQEPGLWQGQERLMLRSVQRLSQYAARADVQAYAGLSLPNPVLGVGAYTNMYGSAARVPAADGAMRERATLVNEIGVALARQFAVYGDVAFGITPKYVDILTYERVAARPEDGDYDRRQEQLTHAFNMDIGVARRYETGWSLGGVVTNLVPMNVTSVMGEEFRLLPTVRFGLALQEAKTTYAADIDVVDQQNWVDGVKRRYFGIGAEYQWWVVQWRAGYRHNLAVDQAGVVTLGMGLQAFGFHIDTAVAGNVHELSATAQFSYRI
ncbi:MAG: conjugal transfer protein TraF [Gammaproteobacteria bacterium]|nr:conjugal transfer protein TraF [Gammaproteobacteria bacterium]